jgi:cardiolipin synthase
MKLRPALASTLLLALLPVVTLSSVTAATTSACGTARGQSYALTILPQASPTYGFSLFYRATAQAKKSVNVVIYEISDTAELTALVAAAHRGVAVHVLLDKDYSGYRVNTPAYNYLRAHHVAVVWGPDATIVHQKTLTVDGTCALIATANLTPKYYQTTRDYVVTDTNQADVTAINATFSRDFSSHTLGQPTTTPALLYSPGAESSLVSLINSATVSVAFESEELRNPYIVAALARASRRAVACTVLMNDDSYYYSEFRTIARAGCHVGLYPATSSGLYIHAKAIIVDATTPSARAFVGSQNASTSSLLYNRELGLILTKKMAPAVLAALTGSFTRDYQGSHQFH